MLDTFLFDLDGTLLPIDMDKFLDIYFTELGAIFSDIIHPKLLVKNILAATDAMINNTEFATNESVFFKEFSSLIDTDIKLYTERFDSFYDNQYTKTKQATYELPLINKCVNILKSKNYNIAVATNPLFPQKAIYQRIAWAGLNIDAFSHITSYEYSHYCKPKLEYYREVLDCLGKKPEQCMMVGNDVQEDIIASKLGIKTFLITNNIINRDNEEICSTYIGTYEDFYAFVCNL